MKQLLIFSMISLAVQISIAQGNLYIGTGATLYTNGASTLTLENAKLSNNGTVLADDGTVVMKGNATNTNSSIGGNSCELKNLTLDKSANNAELQGNVIVKGNLTFTNGNLDVNGNVIDLQGTGSLQNESNTSRAYSSTGSGSITTNVSLNAPSASNPGNLGLNITSSQNLGATSITRYFNAVTAGSGAVSILRNYQVTPSNNSGLNATVRVNYFENELNSQNESDLVIWTGLPWQSQAGSIKDATNNYAEYVGLSSLNTVSIGIPLSGFSVSLVSPPAHYCAGGVITVTYNAVGNTFNTGNVFSLQLSDASGSFASPVVLKTLTSTATSGNISGMIPWAQGAGTGYRVRVVSSNVATTSSDNGSNFEIKTSTATASVTFSGGFLANPTATGNTNKLITGCQGTSVILTANVSGQVSYEWRSSNVFVPGSTNAPTLTVNNSWGDYQLVAIDANGCGAAADTVGINLMPTPIANVGPNRNICPGTTVTIGSTAQSNTTYTWTPSTHLSSASAAIPTVLATLPSNTTYTLQVSKSYTIMSANFSCASTPANVSVSLLTQPTPPVISLVSPSNKGCQGGTALSLTASSVVGTLRWYRGTNAGPTTTSITESSTGGVPVVYTARNMNASGCLSAPSNSITLTIFNAPTPTVTSSVGTLQSGSSTQINVCSNVSSAVFTANVPANANTSTPTYAWYNPVTSSTTTIGTGNTLAVGGITTSNQRRFVKATYVYPSITCTANSLTMDIRKNAAASGCRVMQNEVENSISAYPNPTNGELYVKIQVIETSEATLSLVNQLGQVVWREKRNFEQGDTEVNLSLKDLASGIYHLILDKEDTHQTVKVVKE